MAKGWGGKRKGAGRPPTGRKRRTFYLTDEEHIAAKEFIEKIRKEANKVKKFEIVKNTIEVKKGEIKEGCTIDIERTVQEPEKLESFDTKEEALKALANYQSKVRELSGHLGIYYEVTEYYIEENDYDEDGEWVSGGDIHAFSKMPEQ